MTTSTLYGTYQFSNIRTLVQDDGPNRVKIFYLFLDLRNLVHKVTFEGAIHIKEEELRNLTGVKPVMDLNPNLNKRGCQKILEKYEEMGRPFTSCTLVKGGDPNDTEVIYAITESPKIKVRDIQFTGNKFAGDVLLKRTISSSSQGSRIGGTYHKECANSGIHAIIEFYRAVGYQDVRVSLETQRDPQCSEVTLLFHIQEGLRYRKHDATQAIGAQTNSFECLDGPLLIKPGEYLDQSMIEARSKPITVQYEVEEPNPPQTHNRPDNKPGERSLARIGQILVGGNQRISSESIRAHVPLVPGQVLTYRDLRQAEKILAKLGLFVVDLASGVHPTITVSDVENDSTLKNLLINVREK